MNEFIILVIIIGSISSFPSEIDGAKVFGPKVNISELLWKIWLKGSGQLKPNKLPDVTYNDKTRQRWPGADAAVGRRHVKNILADHRHYLYNTTNLFSNDYEDYVIPNDGVDLNSDLNTNSVEEIENLFLEPKDKSDWNSLEELENLFLEPEKEIYYTRRGEGENIPELKKIKKQSKRNSTKAWKESQIKKIGVIKAFLESTYIATDYLYKEIQRIQRKGQVMDPLREMVQYLSRPYMDDLVKSVFNCFKEQRLTIVSVKDVWKYRTPNNVIIHPLKDPYMPGYY